MSTGLTGSASMASASTASASSSSTQPNAESSYLSPLGAKRRISYVLPSVDSPPTWFRLPSLADVSTSNKRCRSSPLLLSSSSVASAQPASHLSSTNPFRPGYSVASGQQGDSRGSAIGSRWDKSRNESHPRHTLPVSSLAIDPSTVVGGASSNGVTPGGILYTSGRDGLVIGWELGLKMRRRRRKGNPIDETELLEEGVEEGTRDDFSHSIDEDPSRHSDELGNDYEWEVVPPDPEGSTMEAPSAKFRQCIGSHTDWINDIVLCNNNQTVVSASSDRTLKVWNPHDTARAKTPQVLGSHKDYVKALAHSQGAGWIASGSFDKSIKIWDIKETRADPIVEIPELSVRSSIYALSTNLQGSVIAAGVPEKTVKVWDPRSGSQVSQLVGHTDNVRSVVVSQDGRHLLSAGSDCTVRLWSLAEQRCLHTFTHHEDSVWSLFSDHPDLDVFYSGDRAGNVCKVDWERCGEVAEGECVVLARDCNSDGKDVAPFFQSRHDGSGDKSSGVHKIVAIDDTYVWTAGANSRVSRWRDIPRRIHREAVYPIYRSTGETAVHTLSSTQSPPILAGRTGALKQNVPGHKPIASALASTASFAEPQPTSQRDDQARLFGIPFDSLVCLAPPNDPFGAPIGVGTVSLRQATSEQRDRSQFGHMDSMFSSASLISIPSALRSATSHHGHGLEGNDIGPIKSPLTAAGFSPPRPERPASIRFATDDTSTPKETEREQVDEEDEAALRARSAFEERGTVIDATPLRSKPGDVIEGTHGQIRSAMLNDRRHVLTIDTSGTTFLWDIIAGRCLGAFDWREIQAAALQSNINGTSKASGRGHDSPELLPGEVLELVKERIEGEAAMPLWCTVDTRTGSLTVHLEYPRCFDAEVYLDECSGFIRDLQDYKEDQRSNAGKWVLRNLFDGFLSAEQKLRGGPNAKLKDGVLAAERPEISRTVGLSISLGHLSGHESGSGPDKAAEDIVHTPGMTMAVAVTPQTPVLLPKDLSPLTPGEANPYSKRAPLSGLAEMMVVGSSHANGKREGDYFSLNKGEGLNTSPAAAPGSHERVATTNRAGESTDTPTSSPGTTNSGSSGLMGRLRIGLGSSSKNKVEKGDGKSSVSSPPGPDEKSRSKLTAGGSTSTGTISVNPKLAALRQLLAKPMSPTAASETPPISYDPRTAIIISESTQDTGSWQVVYRGLVSTTSADVEAIEVISPVWLLDFLMLGKMTQQVSPGAGKVSFVLQPWKGATPQKREGQSGYGQQPSISSNGSVSSMEDDTSNSAIMPELPSGNARLTATRMLRLKKVAVYVCEKLQIDVDMSSSSSTTQSRAPSIVPASLAGSRRTSLDHQGNHMNGPPAGLNMSTIAGKVQQHQSSTSSATEEQVKLRSTEVVEILCNGHLLPYDATLAQAQRFFWKTSGDVKLEYRCTSLRGTNE